MKKASFYWIFILIIISFLISLNTIKIFSINQVGLFITVIGLIYGLIAAFTINAVWNRFDNIRNEISEEVSSLEQIWVYTRSFSNKVFSKKVSSLILRYCQEVPNIEWKDYWLSEKTHAKFRNLVSLIATFKPKNEGESVLFDQITDEVSAASKARDKQILLSKLRLTKSQWFLNIFLSFVLVFLLAFVTIPRYSVSVIIVTVMISATLIILFIMYQFDSMKILEDEVSVEPYTRLENLIKKEK